MLKAKARTLKNRADRQTAHLRGIRGKLALRKDAELDELIEELDAALAETEEMAGKLAKLEAEALEAVDAASHLADLHALTKRLRLPEEKLGCPAPVGSRLFEDDPT